MVGFFAVMLFTACWLCGALFDPNWSYGMNMVSDLGVSEDPVVSMLFLTGCVGGGALFTVFGILAWKSVNKIPEGIPYILCIPAGICLMLIGIFTEGTAPHNPSAYALMILALVAIVISIVMEHRKGSRFMPILYTVLLILSALSLLVSKAYGEANAIASLLIWVFTICTPVDELMDYLIKR